MPKSDSVEKRIGWTAGYVYFTNDVYEAVRYGLRTSLLDSKFRNIPENVNIPNHRDPMVLAVKTSHLRDSIEIDPEVYLPSSQETANIRNGINQFYRHKGDIKLGYLFPYKRVSFDTVDSNTINEITKELEERRRSDQLLIRLNDMGLKLPDKDNLFKNLLIKTK
jgi:hypothetical protein